MRNLFAVLALLSGCYKDNPNYSGDDAVVDADDMTGPSCETSADCAGDLPVCDGGVCVQCTAVNQEACSPSLVCGDDNRCRGCESNDECLLSQACLASGQCADVDDVAYVAPNEDGLDCTFEAPCDTLLEAVNRNRPVIKLATGRTSGTTTAVLTNRAIEIVADPGAEIESGSVSVLRLDGTAAAAIVSDVTIIGTPVQQTTAGAFSVSDMGGTLALRHVTVYRHAGPALSAAGGDVTVQRCNFVENKGGGIGLSDTRFSVTSSLIVNNGSATSPFGGVRIALAAAGSKFAFNTVASNVSDDFATAGMDCTPAFPFQSSIVRNNNVSGTCEATYTLFVPLVALPPGSGNVAGPADFIEMQTDRYNQPDFYRIGPDSAALDVAMPDDDVTVDIDGDPRTAAPDMGADER